MRTWAFLIGLFLLCVGCREKEAGLVPDVPVQSLSNLPLSYQPLKKTSAPPGRLKSEVQNGRVVSEWVYNDRGQLLEWRSFQNGAVTLAVQYRYDAAGHLRFVQHFDNNCLLSSYSGCTGPVFWTSYDQIETDAAGRVIKSRTFRRDTGDWSPRSTTTYTYDAGGQLTGLQRYSDPNVLTTRQTLTYDNRGNVTEVREQNPQASPDLADRTFRYSYDTGRNPYYNTLYYASALFLSRHNQLAPGTTYAYRSDSLPVRIWQNGSVFELNYY